MSRQLERAATVVTRERVVAPPERHIQASEAQLVEYFQGVFGGERATQVPVLAQLVEGVTAADFQALRRRLLADYEYFGAASEAKPGVELKLPADLDDQELRFLGDFAQLMEASQFRHLSQGEWDAAQAEDFLFTLPCDVQWGAMDTQMLRRYWAAFPAERGAAPAQTAERILIFQRGAEVAHMQGSYFMLKINLLISMWILQPLFRLFQYILKKLKVAQELDVPKGLATTEGPASIKEDPVAKAELERAQAQEAHPAATSIERRTFARVFPDSTSVLKQFFKQVRLQEACFRDVVVVYRLAVPEGGIPASEVEVIKEADPKFMMRNIVLRRFRGIPLADLELVMPEKKVFVPPKVFVEMAVTLIGGVVALVMALAAGKDRGWGSVWAALTLLGGRASAVYFGALAQRNLIENAMGKMLYERTVGSGEGVLTGLVDGVCRQRVREILICYCMLLNSPKPLTAAELDAACESFLATQFGSRIDFCCEEALPALLKWGLAAEGAGGGLTAAPLPEALRRLDEVWDGIFNFSSTAKNMLAGATDGAEATAAAGADAAGAALGKVLSTAKKPVTTALSPASGTAPSSSKGVKGMFKRMVGAKPSSA